MRLSDHPTLLELGVRLDGSETEEALSLVPGAASSLQKIYEFYKLCRTGKNDLKYSCHTFTLFAAGLIDTIKYPDDASHSPLFALPAADNECLAGDLYAVIDSRGQARHTMIGVNRPDASLSVTGSERPLWIVNNADLRKVYAGEHLAHLLPLVTRSK